MRFAIEVYHVLAAGYLVLAHNTRISVEPSSPRQDVRVHNGNTSLMATLRFEQSRVESFSPS